MDKKRERGDNWTQEEKVCSVSLNTGIKYHRNYVPMLTNYLCIVFKYNFYIVLGPLPSNNERCCRDY